MRPVDIRRIAASASLLVVCSCTLQFGQPSSSGTAVATSPSPLGAPAGTEAAQREEAPPPAPRQETAAAVLDGKLYVIAGFDSQGKGTSTTFVTDGKGWQSGPSLPAVLDHPSAAAIGRRLYLAGGYSNGAASEKVYVLSTAGDAWQPASPMRHARGALALVAVGNNLFALGGTN